MCFCSFASIEHHNLTIQSNNRCALMVYNTTHRGFLCYDDVDNYMRISKNVVFFEHEYYFKHHISNSNGVLLN